MPSREEIVEWLREAGVTAEMLYAKTKNPDDDRMNLFFERAVQVSAMRCETCKYYDKQHQLCEVVGGSELLIPVYFGCFSHE